MKRGPQTLFRIWLILWVIGLPLIHIHPEADHAHGMDGHVHGGTFHTILSSKPICAYAEHRHHHESLLPGESFGNSESSSHVHHGLEHSTYNFTVLNSTIDPTQDETISYPTSPELVGSEPHVLWHSPLLDICSLSSNISLLPVISSSSARAPPILSL